MGTDRPTTQIPFTRLDRDRVQARSNLEKAQEASMESEGGLSLPPPLPAPPPLPMAASDPDLRT